VERVGPDKHSVDCRRHLLLTFYEWSCRLDKFPSPRDSKPTHSGLNTVLHNGKRLGRTPRKPDSTRLQDASPPRAEVLSFQPEKTFQYLAICPDREDSKRCASTCLCVD
jgi:hypothetical protein